MLRAAIFAVSLLGVIAVDAAAEVTIDPDRGVIGSTAEKRAWINDAMVKELGKGRQLQVMQHQLGQMDAKQIDVLANQLAAHQKKQLQQAQWELAQAQAQLAQMRQQQAFNQRFNNGFNNFNGFNRPVVGYQPIITWLPQGTQLGVSGVVSPDRRHVRISANPVFSHIPSVDTFNFVTGQTNRVYNSNGYNNGYNRGYSKSPFYNNQIGARHQPPNRRLETPKVWHDGMRTRVGPRPSR